PIWEPYHLFFKIQRLFGKKEIKQSDFISTGKKSFFQSVSSWIRGNFFIPDARVFWVKPSVTFLTDFIKSNQIEKIVTTGPPHSIHLIGQRLKKRMPEIKWVADFRDPWSEWDLLDTLSLTSWARSKHRRLEREVLSQADKVITIAPYHVKRLELLGNRQVDLITNGFDEEDFNAIKQVRNKKFTIRHIGIVDELRDPRPVMNSLKEMLLGNPILGETLAIEFIGNVNSAFKSYVEQDSVLSQVTQFVDQVPHSELLKIYGRTDLQLLVLAHTAIAPGNLPGKFFEYLASGNPILAIGPVDGDAADVLKETNAGVIRERENEEGIKSSLQTFYSDWEANKMNAERSINKYFRKELTEQLAKLLSL
ncbi:MAG: glycosyl transferase, partial [Cyclobacteriaceae bacterium]